MGAEVRKRVCVKERHSNDRCLLAEWMCLRCGCTFSANVITRRRCCSDGVAQDHLYIESFEIFGENNQQILLQKPV